MSSGNLSSKINLVHMVLALAVLLQPSENGARAQISSPTVASQLIEHYGQGIAQYIIINFNFFLGNPSALETYLLRLRQQGRLSKLCMFIPQNTKCLNPRFGVFTQTQLIVNYLKAECCTPVIMTLPPTTSAPRTTPMPIPTTPSPTDSYSCGRVSQSIPRILPGVKAVAGQFPWACMLLGDGEQQCGCVIIDRTHVLTAGHCLNGKVENNFLTDRGLEVIAGKLFTDLTLVERTEQRVRVVGGKRHENYDPNLLINDIAVLLLERPLTFTSFVTPACLPPSVTALPSPCFLAGYGTLAFTGPVAEQLMFDVIQTYTADACLQTFQATTPYDISIYLTPGVICAANGTAGGKDACRGDSGSPLTCTLNTPQETHYLYGIVSSGFGCGQPGQPGFYTYIVRFVDWIYAAVSQLR
ncbi:trypsin-1-like [Pomacea canaliculata]|nr:trypsin-1-like [Pomacea canaliculata]